MMYDEVQIVSLCKYVQMERSPQVCLTNMVKWIPQGGHRCGACHNVSNAKVSIKKPLEN